MNNKRKMKKNCISRGRTLGISWIEDLYLKDTDFNLSTIERGCK
jgi:hypothetical protein